MTNYLHTIAARGLGRVGGTSVPIAPPRSSPFFSTVPAMSPPAIHHQEEADDFPLKRTVGFSNGHAESAAVDMGLQSITALAPVGGGLAVLSSNEDRTDHPISDGYSVEPTTSISNTVSEEAGIENEKKNSENDSKAHLVSASRESLSFPVRAVSISAKKRVSVQVEQGIDPFAQAVQTSPMAAQSSQNKLVPSEHHVTDSDMNSEKGVGRQSAPPQSALHPGVVEMPSPLFTLGGFHTQAAESVDNSHNSLDSPKRLPLIRDRVGPDRVRNDEVRVSVGRIDIHIHSNRQSNPPPAQATEPADPFSSLAFARRGWRDVF